MDTYHKCDVLISRLRLMVASKKKLSVEMKLIFKELVLPSPLKVATPLSWTPHDTSVMLIDNEPATVCVELADNFVISSAMKMSMGNTPLKIEVQTCETLRDLKGHH